MTGDEARDRFEYLIDSLAQQRATVLLPTPVFAELISKGIKNIREVQARLSRLPRLIYVPFDQRAAIECGMALRERWAIGGVKKLPEESWPKVKFDHQIASIAKVQEAETVFSDDSGVQKMVRQFGMNAMGISDLAKRPLDPEPEFEWPEDKPPDA